MNRFKQVIGRLSRRWEKRRRMEIPQSRLLAYLLILGLLPVGASALWLAQQVQQWRQAEQELTWTMDTTLLKRQKQWRNTQARQHYAHANHFFINHQLETLPLLQRERQALEALLADEPALPNKEVVKRLQFLSGSANALTFREGEVAQRWGIRESTEKLAHPVEADTADLQKILDCIEGAASDEAIMKERPLLLITDFKLRRQKGSQGNEVFAIDLQLLKREFPD